MTKTLKVRLAAGLGAIAAAGLLAGAAAGQFRFGYEEQSGKDLYEHICQGCHMPDAKGAVGAGAYPALAGNIKLKSALYPAMVVIKGQKAMPSFGDLTDAQVVEVVNYIRTHFGNSYADPLTLEQAKALRPKAGGPAAFRAG